MVSEDKPERDLVDKRGDYAEGGVPEYWIVNPQTETITVLRLRGESYEEAGIYRRGESATSVLLGGFSVPVTPVFESELKADPAYRRVNWRVSAASKPSTWGSRL